VYICICIYKHTLTYPYISINIHIPDFSKRDAYQIGRFVVTYYHTDAPLYSLKEALNSPKRDLYLMQPQCWRYLWKYSYKDSTYMYTYVVFVHMYIYTYIYMYLYFTYTRYIYTHIYIYIYISIYIYIYIYIYICMHLHEHLYRRYF